ncbi:MAG TPA: flavodoxin family protein [Bacillales bacterium]|nr:flavodoxin family protein [Bacillales bacterium]
MENITIVFAHPWKESYNAAIFRQIKNALNDKNQGYEIIDLYADGFNPIMSKQELTEFSKGKTMDPLVEKYQSILKKTDHLIFIFPVWWNDVPAMIKGFLDKVFIKNFAYEDTKTGIKGHLNNIKKATVINTGKAPKWYLQFLGGNAIKGVFINNTLKSIGIKKREWLYLGLVNKTTTEKRNKFLNKVSQKVKNNYY